MAMTWQEKKVADLGDFIAALADIMPSTSMDRRRYWFRGQPDAKWGLAPSFMRSRPTGIQAGDAISLEDAALKAFKSVAHFFVSPPLLSKVRTKPCWWALM